MDLRKNLFQFGGFVAIVVVVDAILAKPEGPVNSFLIGLLLAILYIPIFNRLYREGPGQGPPVGTPVDAEPQKVKVTVKHSRLSRSSSLGMVLLGVLTLLFVSGFFGVIIIVIGLAMYWFYRRQSRES